MTHTVLSSVIRGSTRVPGVLLLCVLSFAGLAAQEPAAQLPPRYDEALKLFVGGRYDESLTIVRSVFDDNRNSVELRLLAASNYIGLGDYRSAQAHMSFCMRDAPTRAECPLIMAQSLRRERRFEDGLRVARNAVAKHGDLVPLRLEIAALYYESGRPREARPHLDRALAKDPNNFAAIYLDGLIFLKSGQWSNAEFRLRNALDLKPKNRGDLVNLYVNLGLSIEKQGDQAVEKNQKAEAAGRFRDAAAFYGYALTLDASNALAKRNKDRVEQKGI